jgi:hypothetical protein
MTGSWGALDLAVALDHVGQIAFRAAVVGGEQNQRALAEAEPVQGRHEPADDRVHRLGHFREAEVMSVGSGRRNG